MHHQVTLGQAKNSRISINATCNNGHEFAVDIDALIALRGRFAPLDLALLQIVWCPECSSRENSYRMQPLSDA